MQFKTAIVGAGDIAQKAYLPYINQSSLFQFYSICSRTQVKDEIVNQYSFDVVTNDYKKAIEGADVVFVLTPTNTHKIIAWYALNLGKHVLVEKPLCDNLEDSLELIEFANRCDSTFYPAFNNFFREENQWLTKQALEGELGSLELLNFEWFRTKRHQDKSWLFDPSQAGGGVFIDLGSHLIHYVLNLFPNRNKYQITAKKLTHLGSVVEDTMAVDIIIDDKAIISIKTGWDMPLNKSTHISFCLYGDQKVVSTKEYQGLKTDGYSN
ncbi:hypothetical protein BVY03_01235, partial [bacterium K02(2017)]